MSEQLDCVPAQFFVLRHIRGKCACACCQTTQAAPIPAQMIESDKLNGHAPWAHLEDVFKRLPTLKHRDLAQLLPHNWRPATDVRVTSPIAAPTTAPKLLAA